jgi:Carboxypeptidase regulatory-like domain
MQKVSNIPALEALKDQGFEIGESAINGKLPKRWRTFRGLMSRIIGGLRGSPRGHFYGLRVKGETRKPCRHLLFVDCSARYVITLTLMGLSTCLRAQEPVSTSASNLVSQDAPRPNDAAQIPGSAPVPAATASIAGTVRDEDGVAVPGARVTLAGPNNGAEREATSDSRGAFTFPDLVPGVYRLEISEVGLDRPVTAEVVLGAGERRELPIVGTRILTTTVHVEASVDEVARSQVEAQETQRVLGFFPNYYSSYIWDAAPMTPKLKFKLALRATTDPVSFLAAAGVAGVEQKHKTFPGYGQGSEGYAKRFGAAYADALVSKMVSRAILPTVLHQDPRYFYRGSGSVRSRIFYALRAAVITRGDNGQMATELFSSAR